MDKQIEEVITYIVSKHDKHLRKDLYQECWLSALESIDRYDQSKGSVFTFLYSRMLGTCKDWISKNIQNYTSIDNLEIESIDTPFEVGEKPRHLTTDEFINELHIKGYTAKQILEEFRDVHNFNSLSSIYNRIGN